MSVIGLAIGAEPDGGDDITLSQSVPSPVDVIADDPTAERIYLLIATPYDPGVASEITKYISSAPFTSASDDTPALEQFEERLENPYNVQVDIFQESAPLAGVPVPGFGAQKLVNADAGIDDWNELEFAGRTLKTFLGTPGRKLKEFAQISETTAAGLSWDLDRVTLPVRDFRLLLQKPINSTLYLGAAEEITGTDISFDAGAGAINSTTTDLSGLEGYSHVVVTGSANNNVTFKIDSVTTNQILVDETVQSVTNEAAGASVALNSTLEGGDALEGKAKPQAYGRFEQFEPVLVDGPNHYYQLNDGAIQEVTEVLDRGVALSFDADVADITTAAPAPGEYATSLATGHIALGEAPDGKTTVTGKGDKSGTLGYKETIAGIIRKIATEELGFVDPDGLDSGAFADIDSSVTQPVGYTTRLDQVDGIAAFADIAGSLIHVSFTRLGKLTLGQIVEPSTATASFSLTEDDLREPSQGGQFTGRFAGLPIHRVRLGHKPYEATLSADEIAGSVSEADRQDFGEPYRFVVDEDTSVLTRVPEAKTLEILTRLAVVSDATAEAARVLALLSPTRHLYQAQLEAGLFRYSLGDIVELTVNRYDLTTGKNFVVLGWIENAGEAAGADSITLILWG